MGINLAHCVKVKTRHEVFQFVYCISLVGLVGAAPYEVEPTPEKLIHPGSSVQCGVTYALIWDTEYHEEQYQECETVYEQQCHVQSERLCQNTTREECHIVQDQVCNTIYNKVCRDEYKTVLEPYTETECVTLYKEDCEYHWEVVGTEKVWAVNPATCKQNPYDECHDVEKTHSKQVSYQVCEDVPAQKCHYVDRKECYLVPDQVCKSQPITKCSEVPKQICHLKHKRVPVRVSKKVPKKVCNVPGQHPAEFAPVASPAVAAPVPVVPLTTPEPVTTTTTDAPSTLDDILNRNEASNNILFDSEAPVDNQFSDRFVFEENDNNNSTIKFNNE